MKNTITLSQLQTVETYLKQDGYIKESLSGGLKIKWFKEFDKWTLSVIFKESRDTRNNKIISFKYKAEYADNFKTEFKLDKIDMDLAKQMCDEVYLILEY